MQTRKRLPLTLVTDGGAAPAFVERRRGDRAAGEDRAVTEKFRAVFFMVVSLIAIVLIAMYYARLASNQKMLRVALALVMGGAVGNLIDRVIRSYVIDFIDWHWNDPNWMTRWHWPTFNVADTGISIGVALIALDTIRQWWAMRKQPQSTASMTTV